MPARHADRIAAGKRPILFVNGHLENLGDLALFWQNAFTTDRSRRFAVRRWSKLPRPIEDQLLRVGASIVNGKNPLSFGMACLRSDIVIGGGQIVRSNASIASLVALAIGTVLARLAGGVVSTRGLGVGAVEDGVRRRLWRIIVAGAAPVCVRDPESARHATQLVGPDRVTQTADMAFLPTSLHDLFDSRESAPDLILIAPCIDASEGRTALGSTAEALFSAVRRRLARCKPVFVCHDPRPALDVAAARELGRRLDLACAPVIADFDLAGLASTYRRAALVVTNRLHAMIFGLLAGVPVLALGDGSSKVSYICERFGVPMISLDRRYSSGELDTLVQAALDFDRGHRQEMLSCFARLAGNNLGAA